MDILVFFLSSVFAIRFRESLASLWRLDSGTEISKNICKQGWKQEQNPKQGSEGQVPKQGPQAKLRKAGSWARSHWTGLKQAGKVSKNRFPRESSQETGSQARLPRTGSPARFR